MRKFIGRSAAALAVAAAVLGTSPAANAQGSDTIRFRAFNRIETFTAVVSGGQIVRVAVDGANVRGEDIEIYVHDAYGNPVSVYDCDCDNTYVAWVPSFPGRITIRVVISRPGGEYTLSISGGFLLRHVTRDSGDPTDYS